MRYKKPTAAKAAANEMEVEARRQAAPSEVAPAATIPWGDWWDQLVTKREFSDTDTATTESYIVERFLRPKWGHVPLNEISYELAEEWVESGELKVRKGMSPAYVHRIYSVFNVSIKAAMKKPAILKASPLAGIELPKRLKRPKPYLSVRSNEAMAKHLRDDYRDAIEFQLETGLRPGEVCGLHSDRLDLDRGWMLVAETFVKRRGVIRPFPKDGDVRSVPLTDKAIKIASRRIEGRDESHGCGFEHTDESVPCSGVLVFLTDRGRIMHPDTMGYHMKNAAKKAKVARRSPYAVRRGWATRAAEGGLDAFQIAEILGHETLDQAQEYVQQTPMARMKLTSALTRYPALTVIPGGLGQAGPAGAEDGAPRDSQAIAADHTAAGGNTA
ncbi:tyrosine-type recombinase/integrase [Amycolatopsis sp. H20-H5]|uniref:tyrosine-type recombinase/integrase n=1 Tax=Amycolatopsis sp. H20-H5 TaxID=3046309 RepID=UPI002DBC6DA2|nr:tyrosine-type recombinase/integrase [Amycolatopsis sp. H20-H5]MEC3975107.1 tyrosine-type recombinase/integrase [Amycolatopsis sp. H20-H5]